MEDQHTLDASADEGRRMLLAAFETAPAGHFAVDPGLFARLRRESRRRRRVRTMVPAGAAVAAGGAAAIGVLLTATVAASPSALAAVTLAASKTSAQSFRVTAVTTIRSGTAHYRHIPGVQYVPNLHTVSSIRIGGSYDPAHARGEEVIVGHDEALTKSPAGHWKIVPWHWRHQIRFVGGHIYVWSLHPGSNSRGKHWLAGRSPQPWPPVSDSRQIARGFLGGRPVDPAALLGLLKSSDSVTDEGPASGPGWTGTKYGFTVRLPKDDHARMTGTVYVDNHGRVRRMVTVTANLVPARLLSPPTPTPSDFSATPAPAGSFATPAPAESSSAPAPAESSTTPTPTPTPVKTTAIRAWRTGGPTATEDVRFSDFGTPVSVSAPPASDVYNVGKYLPMFLGL